MLVAIAVCGGRTHIKNEPVHVDSVELNVYHQEKEVGFGRDKRIEIKPVFEQVILWRWNRMTKRHNVAQWRMVRSYSSDNESWDERCCTWHKVGKYWYVTVWRRNEAVWRIRTPSLRLTETLNDPERDDREHRIEGDRRPYFYTLPYKDDPT